MQLIRGLHNLRSCYRGCVASIGNFDGVHLGHQAVLGQLAERAAELGLPTVVITFEPQPREFFAQGAVPPRLTRFREKMQALRPMASLLSTSHANADNAGFKPDETLFGNISPLELEQARKPLPPAELKAAPGMIRLLRENESNYEGFVLA